MSAENRSARRARKFGHAPRPADPVAEVPERAEASAPAAAGDLPAFMPIAVTTLEMAFGGSTKKLMVPMADIPQEFQRGHTKWNAIQSRWFFSGLPKTTEFVPKDGIDVKVALRHLSTIQGSFEPKHEHKEACVAYLMSLWFDDVKIPEVAGPRTQEVG